MYYASRKQFREKGSFVYINCPLKDYAVHKFILPTSKKKSTS